MPFYTMLYRPETFLFVFMVFSRVFIFFYSIEVQHDCNVRHVNAVIIDLDSNIEDYFHLGKIHTHEQIVEQVLILQENK